MNPNNPSGNPEWRPEGEGPHKTLAGNLFDPMVAADGQKGGLGVGGTSERRIEEEGAEHLRQHGAGTGLNQPTMGTTQPTLAETGMLSSPNAMGSTFASSTGVPSRDFDDSMQSGSTMYGSQPPLRENMQPYLGGASSGVGMGGPPMTSGMTTGYPATGSGYDTGSSDYNIGSRGEDDRSAPRTLDDYSSTAGAVTGRDPVDNSSKYATGPTDSDVTTGALPNESADPSAADTSRGLEDKSTGGAQDDPDVAAKHAEKPPPIGSHGRLDNPDSIPTAGGEKLGSKHWGESAVVPDVPKLRESNAGVSSSHGQPDKTTSANTAQNTGGATGGPQHKQEGHDDGGDMSMMDKIKSKMGM